MTNASNVTKRSRPVNHCRGIGGVDPWGIEPQDRPQLTSRIPAVGIGVGGVNLWSFIKQDRTGSQIFSCGSNARGGTPSDISMEESWSK